MLLLPCGVTQNASAPPPPHANKEKSSNVQFAGLAGKAFWEDTMHSQKTTLIINPGSWNTLQTHCYKFNIYTKSGGWSSCYYREGKHEKLPEREAHLLPNSPNSYLSTTVSSLQEMKLNCQMTTVAWPVAWPGTLQAPHGCAHCEWRKL